ncbi:hypothetical protein TcWFU_003902 [Taenia crassiceps]|uniref:SH2 domain-containing protein n=1 Tax=Taenia crassiceps TaxID=6207 RepID=A0ABR4Q2Y6_9CEST
MAMCLDTDRSGAITYLNTTLYLCSFNYIVRPSSEGNFFAVSVRSKGGQIKHYKIYFEPSDQSCYLFPNKTFQTVEDLVVNYMETEIEPDSILQAYRPFKDSLPA